MGFYGPRLHVLLARHPLAGLRRCPAISFRLGLLNAPDSSSPAFIRSSLFDQKDQELSIFDRDGEGERILGKEKLRCAN